MPSPEIIPLNHSAPALVNYGRHGRIGPRTFDDRKVRPAVDVSNFFASSTPLHVSGNHLQDPDGNSVVLRGVNIAGLESSPTGDLDNEGNPTILQSADVALNDWHANLIRLTVYPDFWLGHDESATDGDGNSLGSIHLLL